MRLLTAGSLVRVQQGEPKKALAFASAFFNEINPFRDLWNALRAWNTPTACEIAAAVRIYFISLDAKHQISQFVEQIISPWAKRTISLFVWTKRFEYWARSVSRLGVPRCLRQMKRCSEQEEITSIAKRSTVLGCSISFFSAFGENSFITYLVLSPKCSHFGASPCKATMLLTVCVVGSSPKRLSNT